MFAPPICRRRWRDNAFRTARSDEDGGNTANIAASGASNQTLRDARAALKHSCERRKSPAAARSQAGDAAVLDEGASRHAFRLRTSEEGSGQQAPASASGASNVHGASRGVLSSVSDDEVSPRIRDVRAADLQEEMAGQRFSDRQIRRRRRQHSEHRSERSEQAIKHCVMREHPSKNRQRSHAAG